MMERGTRKALAAPTIWKIFKTKAHASLRKRRKKSVGEAPNDGACGDSGFKRNNYFSGKLLSEKDFRDEQEYNKEKRKLHNRLLHGWGGSAG
jgi:hypothetical protein